MKILISRNLTNPKNSSALDRVANCVYCGSVNQFEESDLAHVQFYHSCGVGDCLSWSCAQCGREQAIRVNDLRWPADWKCPVCSKPL